MIEIVYTVFLGVAMGYIAFFFIACANKWGWLDLYDMYRKKWMPERCEFCLGFWVCCILFAAYFKFSGERFEYIYLSSILIGATVNIKGI